MQQRSTSLGTRTRPGCGGLQPLHMRQPLNPLSYMMPHKYTIMNSVTYELHTLALKVIQVQKHIYIK